MGYDEPIKSFKMYKRLHANIAKELGYSNSCVNKILQATSESEVQRTMITERNRLMSA